MKLTPYNNRFAITLLLLAIIGLTAMHPTPSHAQDGEPSTERPLLITHYMPWYQTPEISGYWGWHWTMEFFNPNNVDEDGRPEIASNYLPLTGPYDSADDAVLEYQVLLMKLSGIDSVVVDWYGAENFRDYAVLNAATNRLFEHIQRAGLRFAICYEDATVRNMVTDGYISGDEAVARGQEDMQYLAETWFQTENYLRHEGQPLLFVFGPQYFRGPDQWQTMWDGIDPQPALITLDNNMSFAALASYPWPPMSMSGGRTLLPAVLDSYLELFYRNAARRDYIVGSAFPGFHDIYAEAGVRSSYGYLDAQDGETLRSTFAAALANNADLIQLVTWNDYGEGTMIEPTVETGYQYLEIVGETRESLDPATFTFDADALRLPLRLYALRKANAGDDAIQARLDDAFAAIIAGDVATAESILAELE